MQSSIAAIVEDHNNYTHGFRWTAQADDILAKVARARATLDKITTV